VPCIDPQNNQAPFFQYFIGRYPIDLSRVNYFGRFGDNYDGRLSV
jgi:hypothetical protein